MGCGVIMYIGSIVLVVLRMIMTSESTVSRQSINSSAFHSVSFEYERKLEARCWSTIFCHTMQRPTTIFLEVYLTNRSHSTRDFFNIFTSYMHSMRPECINAITSSLHHVDDSPKSDMNWSWFGEMSGCYSLNLPSFIPAPKIKSFVFNNPRLARVIIITFESIDLLMKYKFGHWDRKQYVLLLIIFERNHEINNICIENVNDILMKILIDILKGLWKKHGAHNVFIGFPSLNFHEPRLWSYDPFYRDEIVNETGRVFEIDPLIFPSFKRLRDLHGYKLNVGLFEGKLTAGIRWANKSRFTNNHHYHNHSIIDDFYGLDGYLAQTMSKHFNFTVNIVPPSRGVKYGHVENGTAVGTLGDVAYRRIDASFNSQYVKEYIIGSRQPIISLDIEFTVPVDWDRVCIIVPSSQEIPRWLRTFIYLHPAIWACLLLAIILATVVWHLLRNHHHLASNNYSECDKNYLAVFIDTFMLLVGAPIRQTRVLGERILVGALALLGLTIMGAFTGTLYHSFTNEMYYRPIDTLEELDSSGLIVATSSPNLEDIFGPKNPMDESSTLSRLAHKLKSGLDSNVSTIARTAYEGNLAAIYREKIFSIEQHHYVNSKGRSLLHLVSDCPQAYYLAYLMPANSIFLESFNSIITALSEAGIILFWNKHTIQQSINHEIVSTITSKDKILGEPKAFSIHDMQTCFIILAFGLVISFIVFIVEWINIRWTKHIIASKTRISI